MERVLTLKDSGRKLFYSVSGEGIPVMLVHGFAEDGSIWENQLRELGPYFKLIVPDLPGSGRSEKLDQASLEVFAELLNEIADAENLSSFIMIGHSMGGYITLAYAEKYSSRLDAFGLFHSSAYPDDEEKIETRKKGIGFIREYGAEKFIEQATPGLFCENTKKNRPDLVKKIVDRYANFNAESLVQYYEAMISRPDRTRILKEARQPVLFILGAEDKAVPLNKGLEQTHLPDICYIHICKNSGHMGMLEESAECNEVLSTFINQSGRLQV